MGSVESNFINICERTNVAGSKKFLRLIKEGDYAQALGLAFQIADDILDVEGDVEKAGKRLQKDADAGKATFVSLLGLDAAKARAAELVGEACAALDGYGAKAETLKDAARFVIARDS